MISLPNTRYLQWLVFTLLFGALPILLRFTIVGPGMHSDLDWFVLTDFIFLGLILNASAVSSVFAEQTAPRVYRMIVFFAALFGIVLIAFYCADVRGERPYAAWPGVLVVDILALALSYFTTSSKDIATLEKELEDKEDMYVYTKPFRDHVFACERRAKNGEEIDVHEEFAPFLENSTTVKKEFINLDGPPRKVAEELRRHDKINKTQ